VAIVAACVIAGLRLISIFSGDDEPQTPATPGVGQPGPSPDQTPSQTVGLDRILAIIADAHSGRYFSNDFGSEYSRLEEVAFLRGMIESTSGDPTMTDEFYACALSVMETHWSPTEVLMDADSAEEVGSRAGIGCAIYRHRSREGSVPLPESIGDWARFDDRTSIVAVENVRSQLLTAQVEGDVAFYGWNTPTAALMWIRDPSARTIGEAFEVHAFWFARREGLLQTSERTAERIGGVRYVCAPVSRRSDWEPATICVWRDEDLFWMFLDSSLRLENEKASSTAVMARDAVESI
jgi:hypothetical protein